MDYFLRSNWRVSSRIQIARLAGARILRDECIGREKDGGAGFAHAARDLFRLQRGGVAHHLNADIERQQRADRQPEAMKGRQRIEQHVALGIERDMGVHLLHVGDEVGMRKRHTLRFALRAGGE